MRSSTVILDAGLELWSGEDAAAGFLHEMLHWLGEAQFQASAHAELAHPTERVDVLWAQRHIRAKAQAKRSRRLPKFLQNLSFPTLSLGDEDDARAFYVLAYRSVDVEVYAPEWISLMVSPIFVSRLGGLTASFELPKKVAGDLLDTFPTGLPQGWQEQIQEDRPISGR